MYVRAISMRLLSSSENHHGNDYHDSSLLILMVIKHDPSSSGFVIMINHHIWIIMTCNSFCPFISIKKHGHSAGAHDKMECSMAWQLGSMVSSATFVLPLPVGAWQDARQHWHQKTCQHGYVWQPYWHQWNCRGKAWGLMRTSYFGRMCPFQDNFRASNIPKAWSAAVKTLP